MPRPVYVLYANGVIEDKTTNLVSVFTIIERIDVQRIRNVQPGAAIQVRLGGAPAQFGRAKVVAVWMKEAGDEGLFEHEFVIRVGEFEQHIPTDAAEFQEGRHLRRYTLEMDGFPVPQQSCVAEFESRIRPQGGDWVSQSYPVPVEISDVDAGDSAEQAAPTEVAPA